MNKKHASWGPNKRGAAVMTAIVFFVLISVTIVIGLSTPVVREYVTTRDFEKSKGAYYLSEAGSEDAIYRLKKAITTDPQEILSLGGNTATTTITTESSVKKTVDSLGDILHNTRRVDSTITTTIGESFVYGVQAGEGGVYLSGASSITGNLFSVGPVCGDGSTGATCGSGGFLGTNLITGTVVSSGTSGTNGTINRVRNQDNASMYAGNIGNSIISGTPYCNTISGSSPSSCQTLPTQVPSELPITAQEIANWEASAAAGGTVTCDTNGEYIITTSVNLGPKKIPCDLKIRGTTSGSGPTITLRGPVWATGDISIKDNLTLRVDPTFTGQGIVMVADDPNNRTTKSQVKIENNNPRFVGAPGGNSWILFISENNDASVGGINNAIELENGANGDVLLYARLGNIRLKDSASIVNVTGYRLTLSGNTNVTYSTGLQSALFTTGSSGAWWVQDWKEGQ